MCSLKDRFFQKDELQPSISQASKQQVTLGKAQESRCYSSSLPAHQFTWPVDRTQGPNSSGGTGPGSTAAKSGGSLVPVELEAPSKLHPQPSKDRGLHSPGPAALTHRTSCQLREPTIGFLGTPGDTLWYFQSHVLHNVGLIPQTPN